MMTAQPVVGQPAFLAWAAAGFGAELVHLAPPDAPGPSPGKKPTDEAWQTIPVTPDLVSHWARIPGNVGLRTRLFPAVDVDVDDPTVARAIEQLVVATLGPTARRTRPNSARRALLFRLEGAPFRKRAVKFKLPDGTFAKVEILADGQQIAVAGMHPSGVPNEWPNGQPDPLTLAPMTESQRDELLDLLRVRLKGLGCVVDGLANGVQAPQRAPPRARSETWAEVEPLVEEALRKLDPDLDYDRWVAVGMALHAKEPDLSGNAFFAWDAWSSRGKKYPGQQELEKKWRSFRPGGGVNFGSLLTMAGVSGRRLAPASPTYGAPEPTPPPDLRDVAAPEPPEPGSDLDVVPEPDEPRRPERIELISIGAALDREELRLENPTPRVATGWARLDKAIGGGLEVPSLTVIGAGPKSGKSTWAQIVAVRHVEAGGVAYVLDLENGSRRFLRRALCRKAGLGASQVSRALADERAQVFHSKADAEQWREAKIWLRETLSSRLFVEHAPPDNFVARVAAAADRARAESRKLLVVVDSIQKLPGDARDDRRTAIDKWIRLFERIRYEHEAAILAISEIRRGKEGYNAREDAFKESGGIEYAADLALTLNRAAADDDDAEAVSTLRVDLARDCEEDPRGDVASYRPVRPHYGLEEVEPVPIGKRRSGRPAARFEAAVDFVRATLSGGAVTSTELTKRGREAGHSERTIRRARVEAGAIECTVSLQKGWRLP
jgi:KaiC/GvpD/RAD55 family RecA-like ATPase